MKRLVLISLFCLSVLSVSSQSQTTPSNWIEYRIPDICSFSTPQNMELRDKNSAFGEVYNSLKHGLYMEWVCQQCDIFNGDYNLAFQPKGTNQMDITQDDPFATYARILVNFRHVTDDDLNEEMLLGLSAQDKIDYNDFAKEMIRNKLECAEKLNPGYKTGCFEWTPTQFTTIDDVLCIIYDYKRPGYNAQTHVRGYEFYKDDYYIEFILSYNLKDAALYEANMDNFIKYLHFEPTFKQHKYKSPSASKTATYKSIVHNVQYTYDMTKFSQEKINNAPHMLLKLKAIDKQIELSLGTSGDMGYSGYTAHHPDLVEYFKLYDKQITNVQPASSITHISSCQKVTIGDNIKALRSILKAYIPSIDEYVYTVVYRFINDSELQTLNISLSGDEYARFTEIEQSITQGLSFVK